MFGRSLALASLLTLTLTGAPSVVLAAEGPTIAEWVNQNVKLRQDAQALDQPSATGKSLGGIMAGAEVKAIGIVAGGEWMQIELPNKALAYIPKAAVELHGGSAAATPPPAAPVSAAPAKPGAAAPASRGSAALGAPPGPGRKPAPAVAEPGAAVTGVVTRVPNAATLVVGDRRIRLWGVDPGPEDVVAAFDNWLRQSAGTLKCEPVAHTGRYKCLTADGHDVAEVALFSGFDRVGEGAQNDYRNLEDQAREQHHGLWQK